MKKHIGETRETVKPPYPSLTKIALTAPSRLHSLIPHRFHGSPRPSSMHPKTAPILAILGHSYPHFRAKLRSRDAKRGGSGV